MLFRFIVPIFKDLLKDLYIRSLLLTITVSDVGLLGMHTSPHWDRHKSLAGVIAASKLDKFCEWAIRIRIADEPSGYPS